MDPLRKLTITPEMLRRIAELDEFKGRWQAAAELAPERLSALRRVATVESVGSSTRIEGEGQPTTASRLLLDRLAGLGIRIAYHGDFDWAGLSIANLIFERHGAVPWRFTAADYRQTTGGTELTGRPVAAVWDPELAPAMREKGRAVHEEQVIDDLLADLRSAEPSGEGSTIASSVP